MTYTAKIKIQFDGEWENAGKYYSGYEDMLPEEHITMEIPAQDLSTIQLFKFFSNFLRAIGHNENGIMKGACSVAFNEFNSKEDMSKIAHEYDIVLMEDFSQLLEDRVKKEKEIDTEWARIRKDKEQIVVLEKEVLNLKAKLSRYQNPDNPNYTEEEIEAMTVENYN